MHDKLGKAYIGLKIKKGNKFCNMKPFKLAPKWEETKIYNL